MGSKILVAYYSRTGENYCGGAIRTLKIGNTRRIAEKIAEKTDGTLFEIRQKEPYDDSYNTCIEQARQDQRTGARPEIVSFPADMEEYDTIYLGYPNFWSTMPMAVFTFLEGIDTKGKTIHPFCTHEGSGLGRSVEDLRKTCPDARIERGLAVRGTEAADCDADLAAWLAD